MGEGHVIAYGQVEMNRSFPKLNSLEDYHKLAKDFYNNAKDFYDLCAAAAPTLFPKSMALHANACLTCELFLKSLLLAEEYNFYDIKRSERHNLYVLYDHLKQEGKDCIKNSVRLENPADFEKELRNISKGFEVIRYIAECRGMLVDVVFLYGLMRSLAKISKFVIDQL